jgi:hypothetical protein
VKENGFLVLKSRNKSKLHTWDIWELKGRFVCRGLIDSSRGRWGIEIAARYDKSILKKNSYSTIMSSRKEEEDRIKERERQRRVTSGANFAEASNISPRASEPGTRFVESHPDLVDIWSTDPGGRADGGPKNMREQMEKEIKDRERQFRTAKPEPVAVSESDASGPPFTAPSTSFASSNVWSAKKAVTQAPSTASGIAPADTTPKRRNTSPKRMSVREQEDERTKDRERAARIRMLTGLAGHVNKGQVSEPETSKDVSVSSAAVSGASSNIWGNKSAASAGNSASVPRSTSPTTSDSSNVWADKKMQAAAPAAAARASIQIGLKKMQAAPDNDLEDGERKCNSPLSGVQEDALTSNSNNSPSAGSEEEKQEEVDRQGDIDQVFRQHASSNKDERSGPGGEQIDPRDRKIPAVSEKEQSQTLRPVGEFVEDGGGEQSGLQVGTSPFVASKPSYHTLAPANEVAAHQQVGAFREDGGGQSGLQVGTTRAPGASKGSRELEEDESVNEQDEESAVMIIYATLVVEEGANIRRQDSHSSSTSEVRANDDIAVEDGSPTRRQNGHSSLTREGRSNDDIAARCRNSNVVVENVIMDEDLTEHPRTPELVEATRLNDKKTICQHRKTIFAMGLAVFAIILSIVVVFGVERSDDKEKAPQTLPPNEIEVGNTTESFVRDVLPDFTQAALEDPTSDQSLALAWLWKDPNATSRLPNFRRVQRFALATTLFAVTNSIDEYIEQTNWLTEEHECTWLTNDAPTTVCQNEEFQSLGLSEFYLDGTIPPEIGLLTKLVSIDISDNSIFGTLPSELGHLSRMSQFLATNCALVSHYTQYLRNFMSTSLSHQAPADRTDSNRTWLLDRLALFLDL